MSSEYKTLKFPNHQEGLRQKDESLRQLAANGWHVLSESIEPGHIKGGEACCLASSCCLPMGFLARRTPGNIVVTLAREAVFPSSADTQSPLVLQDAVQGVRRGIGFLLGRLFRWCIDNSIWIGVLVLFFLFLAWFLYSHS